MTEPVARTAQPRRLGGLIVLLVAIVTAVGGAIGLSVIEHATSAPANPPAAVSR
jgi:hypothetical protein